ncbi:hypothetical protein SAMN06298216_1541 [Spirosomataceae bacterium TFI 002]|nr:hypothetical protein SAMN06298216_1541 [Spirosomataceae bacterium TFI 002]
MKAFFLFFAFGLYLNVSFAQSKQPIYQDKPFWQDYSIKFYGEGKFKNSFSDRNGNIKVYTESGVMTPYDGQFLYPGTFVEDKTYHTLENKKIAALGVDKNQFVLLDNQAVLSNAWAGSLFSKHNLPQASIFEAGDDFGYLISDKQNLHFVKNSQTLWKGALANDVVIAIKFQASSNKFWILGQKTIAAYSVKTNSLSSVLKGKGFTAFDLKGNSLIVGTNNGYFEFNTATKKQGVLQQKLPVTEITAVKVSGEKIWFGSKNGAFAKRSDGKFDYYNGERWLPSNSVVHISEGPDNSMLILTEAGLGQICFKKMTLEEKANFFDKQVRSRHIRNGFNASLSHMEKGNIATGYLSDSDNDGLWTTMYMGGEIFKYATTKSPEALLNLRESLDAMERLYTINPVPGFPSRSFERRGFIEKLHDPERWQHAPDPEWDWKSTTSSDEVIGHIFAFGAIAELIPDQEMKKRSIALIDTLMSHIVKNDMYLIDFDGKPTLWGKWNPDYVNSFPTNIGDRKLNSSNIIAMLQTAYHFTQKEKYKEKAMELMYKFGYLENLLRPMEEIGKANDNDNDKSKLLSDSWNHSDDEMYFLGYWGLYRYAFDETLREKYKRAIIDHWEAERPEKEGAWNIFTALTNTSDFDLEEAVWYLQEHPIDLINWDISNSHRKDIELLEPNFRKQTTKEVLPPDERPIQRHNGNMFNLDRQGGNGVSENSAGDIWLLPYWMGRYLGVISAPVDAAPVKK